VLETKTELAKQLSQTRLHDTRPTNRPTDKVSRIDPPGSFLVLQLFHNENVDRSTSWKISVVDGPMSISDKSLDPVKSSGMETIWRGAGGASDISPFFGVQVPQQFDDRLSSRVRSVPFQLNFTTSEFHGGNVSL
jgi:hypothetical protein